MNNNSPSSTREHIALALELYRRIPHRHKVTAKELQQSLAAVGIVRDIRTIQRNLDIIAQYFDIEKDDRDKPYGYSRVSPKPLAIGAQEALLVRMAELYLKPLLPSGVLKTLESLFRDAQYYLAPNQHNQKEREWLAKVHWVNKGALHSAGVLHDVFEAISQGLYLNRWLTIHFEGDGVPAQAYNVMPLGLIHNESEVSLVGRSEALEQDLLIALHKVHRVTLWASTFEYPSDFSLDCFVATHFR